MKYKNNGKVKKPKARVILLSLFVFFGIAGLMGGIFAQTWYNSQLKPRSSESKLIDVKIVEGATVDQIASLLEDQEIIRSASAFKIYVRNNNLNNSLKAGEYQLDPSTGLKEIIEILSQGKERQNSFTILPGKRIDQIKQSFVDAGYSKDAVEVAFDVSNYSGHPALVAKPSDQSLEGYLYPETFNTNSTTTPTDIVRKSLDEMAKVLTPDLIDDFQNQGLGIHQAITLASIVIKEAPGATDQKIVAGVFYNRLKIDMMLGSDVTYQYIADITGQARSAFIDSPYNTRMYKGMPPGPISTVNASSLDAVANPTPSEYLFFVAGDDGTIHYNKTVEEHEADAEKYCKILCSTY